MTRTSPCVFEHNVTCDSPCDLCLLVGLEVFSTSPFLHRHKLMIQKLSHFAPFDVGKAANDSFCSAVFASFHFKAPFSQ